jgi:hypothetical protein
VLERQLPCVDVALFEACVRALRPGGSPWRAAALRRALRRRLAAHARRPSARARVRRILDGLLRLGRWLPARPSGLRLARGGGVIALVGGDGAGKSTCARELGAWLGQAFATRTVNLGWPRRSLASLAVGGTLRAGALVARLLGGEPLEGPAWSADERRFPGYLAVLRHVCNARDRHRLYVGIQQFTGAGGVVLCERYPLWEQQPLDGWCVRDLVSDAPNRRLATLLRETEEGYYRRMTPPDQVIVLRLEPELAVRRKPAEPPDYVRRRAAVIWRIDWGSTRAHVVDAGRPLADVLAELRRVIWAEL